MGNTSTKERGTLTPPHHSHHHSRSTPNAGPSGSQSHLGQATDRISTPGGRTGRHHSGRNLENALLGLGVSGRERDRDREREDYRTKEERRAEREKERQRERVRERERSMAEESVDGGFLVTLGVYVGPEDYSLKVVRQLQIERRLAPFWRGLSDHESDWTDTQLVAVARGLPLPAADADPSKLGLPAAQRSRAQSAKTLGISAGSKVVAGASIPGAPVETNIGNGTINNRAVEAVLYKDASECPICFLYYPPHLNKTRCCDQPICSECFVQIKRADPHPPEFSPPTSPNARPAEDGPTEQLVSEPASCPFCKEINFGITYAPPPFRRGLIYSTQQHPYSPHHQSSLSQQSATSSSASLPSSPTGTTPRRSKVAATSSEVITTDMIRPDWSAKLAHARNQQARRAAAATALHTAAFLMGGMGGNSSGVPLSRRFLRRTAHSNENNNNSNSGGSSSNTNIPVTISGNSGHSGDAVAATPDTAADQNPPTLPNILGSQQRRSRLVDLEEMMLMEAIRLSLAEEEERKRKEEKENKKKEKEEKAKNPASAVAKGKMPEMRDSEPQLSSSAPVGSSIVAKHAIQKQGPGAPLSRSSSGSSQESGPRGVDSALGSTSNLASGDEDEGAGREPMFNFKSLAKAVMDDEEEETGNSTGKSNEAMATHVEEATEGPAGSSGDGTPQTTSLGASNGNILASKNAALVKETGGNLKAELPDTKDQQRA